MVVSSTDDNGETEMTDIEKTCDVCSALAMHQEEWPMATILYCCKAHRNAAVDAALDTDEDCCDPIAECGC